MSATHIPIDRKPTKEELEAFFEECRRNIEERSKRKKSVLEMDYHKEYLQSYLWRKIKKRVLERDKRTCQSCGGGGNVVHHRSYAQDVLEGKNDAMLSTVCSGCHQLIHFADNGVRRTDAECDALLLQGQKQTWLPEIKIDLRMHVPERPAEWSRMTAVQHSLWHDRYAELRLAKVRAKNRGKPPKPPGGFFAPEFWPDGFPPKN